MWPFPQNNLRFFHLDMLCPRFRSRNAKWFCLKMGCPAVMTNLRAKIIIHRNQPVELGLPFFLGRLISNKLPDLRVLATLLKAMTRTYFNHALQDPSLKVVCWSFCRFWPESSFKLQTQFALQRPHVGQNRVPCPNGLNGRFSLKPIDLDVILGVRQPNFLLVGIS